jgi:hypothetical protein
VAFAFAGALAAAVLAGMILHRLPIFVLAAVMYGWLVSEAALRAGGRSRSLAVQVVTGIAAVTGSLLGSAGALWSGSPGIPAAGWLPALDVWVLLNTAIGTGIAVARVRFH